MAALKLPEQVLTGVHDCDDLDGRRCYAVDESIRRLDQLAQSSVGRFGHLSAGLRKLLRLAKADDDTLDDLFCVDGRCEADVLGNSAELIDGVLRPAELEAHDASVRDADLILIRTGWGAVRADDPRRYAAEGPGVSPEACEYLIAQPDLKAVALDFISLAAYRRLEPDGVAAHQILCGVGRGDRYVIIVEDVDLAAYPPGVRRIFAIPLFAAGPDSSPCTVFAELV